MLIETLSLESKKHFRAMAEISYFKTLFLLYTQYATILYISSYREFNIHLVFYVHIVTNLKHERLQVENIICNIFIPPS